MFSFGEEPYLIYSNNTQERNPNSIKSIADTIIERCEGKAFYQIIHHRRVVSHLENLQIRYLPGNRIGRK